MEQHRALLRLTLAIYGVMLLLASGRVMQRRWHDQHPYLIAYSDNPAGNDDLFVRMSDNAGQSALTHHTSDEFGPHWSPDGRWIAYYSQRQTLTVYLVQREGGESRFINAAPNQLYNPNSFGMVWSPNARYLLVYADIAARFVRYWVHAVAAGGMPAQQWSSFGALPAWSPDGEWLLATTETSQGQRILYVLHARTQTLQVLVEQTALIRSFFWSPDGRWIFYTVWSGAGLAQLHRLSLENADYPAIVASIPALYQVIGWSSDLAWIYFVSGLQAGSPSQRSLARLNLDTGKLETLASLNAVSTEMIFIPDSESVIYSDLQPGEIPCALSMMTVRGEDKVSLFAPVACQQSFTLSPDREWVIFSALHGNAHDIYRVRLDGTELQNLTQNSASDWGGALSPDGRWLIFNSNRNGIPQRFQIRLDQAQIQRLSASRFESSPQSGWSPQPVTFKRWRNGWLLGMGSLLLLVALNMHQRVSTPRAPYLALNWSKIFAWVRKM